MGYHSSTCFCVIFLINGNFVILSQDNLPNIMYNTLGFTLDNLLTYTKLWQWWDSNWQRGCTLPAELQTVLLKITHLHGLQPGNAQLSLLNYRGKLVSGYKNPLVRS